MNFEKGVGFVMSGAFYAMPSSVDTCGVGRAVARGCGELSKCERIGC